MRRVIAGGLVDNLDAVTGMAERLEIVQVAFASFDVQAPQGEEVAGRTDQRADLISSDKERPDKVGAELSSCSEDQSLHRKPST